MAIALLLFETTRAHAEDAAPSEHVERMLDMARAAARDHQCDAVAEYGAQLPRLDPGAAARFANDPVIASCTHGDRSAGTAVALSLGVTVAGVVAVGIGAMKVNGESPAVGGVLVGVGIGALLVSPTVGHIYAGHTWNSGLRLRVIGLAIGIPSSLGAATCLFARCDPAVAVAAALVALGGVATYAVGEIVEIGTIPRAVHRYNAGLGIAPIATRDGTLAPGLAFSARF